MTILLIDNYDSFTWNIVHAFGAMGADVVVKRNDEISVEDAMAMQPEAIVISPGPCTPNDAGISLQLIEKAASSIPVLGVCLGHQAIGQVFGGKVIRAPFPVHGKTSLMHHDASGVFRGINRPIWATRYHSLIVEDATLPAELQVHARTDDGLIMSFSHRQYPVHGVQFHPESIASEQGNLILRNFWDLAREWNAKTPASAEPAIFATSFGIKPFLIKLSGGEPLSRMETKAAFDIIMNGEAKPAQIAGFLTALRVRGETVEELAGALDVMRLRMLRVTAPENAVDIVGTGGDGSNSLNISTTAALVVAGAGVPVAKHGNRSVSSKSGSADVLEALGVNIELEPGQIERCIAESNFGFMFAPRHHAAMKHVAPIRKEMGIPTIFNLIGPLSNPASVKRAVIGVFSKAWCEPVAEVLGKLGADHVLVVHGDDGLDEITTTDATHVAEWKDGRLSTFSIQPEDFGMQRTAPGSLKGGDAAQNAKAIRQLLSGKSINGQNPYRDAVALNAGAGLYVSGTVKTLVEGVRQALAAIESGAALRALEQHIAASRA